MTPEEYDRERLAEYTLRWCDEDGVVHEVGGHTDTRVYTGCGRVLMTARRSQQFYKTTEDPPTCVRCVTDGLVCDPEE